MKQKTKKVTKQKKPKQKTAKICEKVLQCRREFRVQETICQELGSTYTRFQRICWVKNLLKRKQREEVQLPAMKRKWLLFYACRLAYNLCCVKSAAGGVMVWKVSIAHWMLFSVLLLTIWVHLRPQFAIFQWLFPVSKYTELSLSWSPALKPIAKVPLGCAGFTS